MCWYEFWVCLKMIMCEWRLPAVLLFATSKLQSPHNKQMMKYTGTSKLMKTSVQHSRSNKSAKYCLWLIITSLLIAGAPMFAKSALAFTPAEAQTVRFLKLPKRIKAKQFVGVDVEQFFRPGSMISWSSFGLNSRISYCISDTFNQSNLFVLEWLLGVIKLIKWLFARAALH